MNIRFQILNYGFRSWDIAHWKLNIESLATYNLYRNINFDKSVVIGIDLFHFALQSVNLFYFRFYLKRLDCIRDATRQELDRKSVV